MRPTIMPLFFQFEEISLDLPRFTISFWLHPDDKLDTVKDVLVINRHGDWDLGFKVGVDSTGAITLTMDTMPFTSDSGAVQPNEWNYIAIVVDSPSGGRTVAQGIRPRPLKLGIMGSSPSNATLPIPQNRS